MEMPCDKCKICDEDVSHSKNIPSMTGCPILVHDSPKHMRAENQKDHFSARYKADQRDGSLLFCNSCSHSFWRRLVRAKMESCVERYGRSVSCKLVVLPSLRMGEMKAKESREQRGADSHLDGSRDILKTIK